MDTENIATTDGAAVDLGNPNGTLKSNGQYERYLVLSEEERSKGFVRPLRQTYVHVGIAPTYETRPLTPEELEEHGKYEYVLYEEYPKNSDSCLVGRFWTQRQLDSVNCGAVTGMSKDIAETYARNPNFYGNTFCIGCGKHFPVEEFVWEGTEERVGS